MLSLEVVMGDEPKEANTERVRTPALKKRRLLTSHFHSAVLGYERSHTDRHTLSAFLTQKKRLLIFAHHRRTDFLTWTLI